MLAIIDFAQSSLIGCIFGTKLKFLTKFKYLCYLTITLFCFTETFGFSADQFRMVATLLVFIFLFLFRLYNLSYIFSTLQTLYLHLHLYPYHVSNHILDMSIFLHLNSLLLHTFSRISMLLFAKNGWIV